ncbi:MAG: Ig-like domain-containing protein [Salinigranum sp.]
MKRSTEEEHGKEALLNRRNYLKAAGATAAAGLIFGSAATAGAANYRTVTVGAGQSKRFTVSGGETLENLLIDITADGADAQIVASGDNWTIRNVGFRGKMQRGSNNGGYSNCIKPRGNGTIDHVYMADGTVDGVRAGAIGIPSSNSGHIEIRNCYAAQWTDNALYNANAADNGHGTVHVDNCYFRDNNVAHFRIAADGSVVENSVAHNTGKTPSLPGGAVDATGVYTGYGSESQHVEIRNCDIDCRKDNNYGEAFWSPSGDSWIDVYDTQFAGPKLGNVDLVSGNGNSPDLTPPTGVPMTPEDAASGGSTTTTNTPPSCSLVAPSDGATLGGTVTVQVDASDSEDDNTSLNVGVSIDGGSYQTASYNSSSGHYEYAFDTTSVADGDHTVDARATDSNGATTDAGQVTVTVANQTGSAPTVVSHDVSTVGSHAPNATIFDAWAVSDGDGDLSKVTVEVIDSSGTPVESHTYFVGGYSASDSDGFHIQQGANSTYDLTLTVTDSKGNSTSDTVTVDT